MHIDSLGLLVGTIFTRTYSRAVAENRVVSTWVPLRSVAADSVLYSPRTPEEEDTENGKKSVKTIQRSYDVATFGDSAIQVAFDAEHRQKGCFGTALQKWTFPEVIGFEPQQQRKDRTSR